MVRALACTIVLAVMSAQVAGCQTRGLDKAVVKRALAGGAGSNLDRDEIRAAGELAIPMVFEELRVHPAEPQLTEAVSLVCGMAADGLADPKAPCIRRVLEDTEEPESIRSAAASMLGWYWECPEVQRALVERIRHDAPERVRADCLAALSTRTCMRGHRAKSWKVDPTVIGVLMDSLGDKNSEIRKEACISIASIAIGAIRDGVELAWCRRALIRARRDRAYAVRKTAVEMILTLDQEKRKSKALPGK